MLHIQNSLSAKSITSDIVREKLVIIQRATSTFQVTQKPNKTVPRKMRIFFY